MTSPLPSLARMTALLMIMTFGLIAQVCADTITIAARDLSDKSKNVVAADKDWDSLVVCYGKGGMQQWTVDVKAAGAHYIHFYYASSQRRPVALSINGTKQTGAVLKANTGGFFIPDLVWETFGPFELQSGKNTIRIATKGLMPHLAGLIVSDRSRVRDKRAFSKLFPPRANPIGSIETDTVAARAMLRRLLPGVEHILFVKRYTFQSSHYYTDFIDGCRHFGGNLCLLSLTDGTVKDLVPELSHGIFGRYDLSYDGRRVVFGWKEKLGVGFRIWEVGIDGKGLRQLTRPPSDEDARIAKYKLDWWKSYMHHTDDMHPCYLPDGGICFVSTRCEYATLCDGRDKLTTSVLYRMDGDGRNMERLTNSSISESAPSMISDGRLLYTRWEYLDKGAVVVKGLWAMNPDGTASTEIYGNDIALPDTFNVGREIPGKKNQYIAIGAPHMPLGVGTVIRLDMNKDIRTRAPMQYITPNVDVRQEFGFNHKIKGRWHRATAGPLFMDPFPLSERLFLVSLNPNKPWNDKSAYGLYLLDDNGQARLIYRDSMYSCWMPMPLRARSRPPVVRAAIDAEAARQNKAILMVNDVYHGLSKVKPGAVKFIRINEQVPRPWSARRRWSGDSAYQQHAVHTMDTHYGLKLQHGIVPVEADGSAHFVVPADRNIFLQLLDKDYMEIQRERTYVNYRPGEVRSCVGCHEKPNNTPTRAITTSIAFRRAPSIPGPQPGEQRGGRPLHYPTDVQPVFDRHCISCHGATKPDGDLDLTGTETTLFTRSYENIINRKLLTLIRENHPKVGNAEYLPAYSLGSHASRLINVIRAGDHYDVKLLTEERVRLTTWVDSNGQYYGSYWGRRNIRYRNHPNYRPTVRFENVTRLTPPLPEDKR